MTDLCAVRDASGEFRAVFWPHVGFDLSVPTGELGIGTLKRAHLHCSRSPEELALMHTLKRAMDPLGILNPG